mgnify:CR=1 FL=1
MSFSLSADINPKMAKSLRSKFGDNLPQRRKDTRRRKLYLLRR